MRRTAVLMVIAILGGACGAGATTRRATPPGPPAAASPVSPETPSSPSPSDGPVAFVPQPTARIPGDARSLATALTKVTLAVRRSIDRWNTTGDPSTWPPPRTLVLQALYQQRIYRFLAREPALAAAVKGRLPRSVAREAAANIEATAQIFAHANPVHPSYTMRTRAPEPADVLLGFLREAERRFDVAWEVLAAVAYTETKFGRVVSNSSAGAQGPMQFLPSTWEAYGLGGDIRDPRDAIMGAANYLSASGAPGDYRRALYAYNPVDAYVNAVLLYARTMRRDTRAYYAYYTWQVFVLTTKGDRRITGPGL